MTVNTIFDFRCQLLLLIDKLIITVDTISDLRYPHWLWQLLTDILTMTVDTISDLWYPEWTVLYQMSLSIYQWEEVVHTGYLKSDVVSTIIINLLVRRSSSHRQILYQLSSSLYCWGEEGHTGYFKSDIVSTVIINLLSLSIYLWG